MERIDNSKHALKEEQNYILAKKRVKKIKGFYVHFIVYIIVNLLLSGLIIFGLLQDNNRTLNEALLNFGVYSTWIFWGIGVFFHWLGVFPLNNIMGADWEKKKIEEYLNKNKH